MKIARTELDATGFRFNYITGIRQFGENRLRCPAMANLAEGFDQAVSIFLVEQG